VALTSRPGRFTLSCRRGDEIVEITLLPSSFPRPGDEAVLNLTSYLVNGTVAVDAGALGVFGAPQEQARVRHVLLSHTHADHTATLRLFVENAYEGRPECVVVHGSAAALESLRRDVFNDRVWPDFLALSPPGAPFLRLSELRPGQPVELEGLRVTPVPVDHVVPTLGLILEDETSTVVIVSDTGPTEEVWRRAREVPNLKAVFLEATFPNSMARLAEASKHLTPALLAEEMRKLGRPARFLVVHIKARFHAQVVRELQALNLPDVEVAQPGRAYRF
jgi:ribonuclease BN (tRNA processing enzyme)